MYIRTIRKQPFPNFLFWKYCRILTFSHSWVMPHTLVTLLKKIKNANTYKYFYSVFPFHIHFIYFTYQLLLVFIIWYNLSNAECLTWDVPVLDTAVLGAV